MFKPACDFAGGAECCLIEVPLRSTRKPIGSDL